MGYLRYYLGNVFMGLGLAGLAMGGPWVWLGASTFLMLIVLDLMFQRPDYSERNFKHPVLADLTLYLHAVQLVSLLGLAAWRIGVIASAEKPVVSQLIGCMITVGWQGTLPGLPVMHELLHRKGLVPRFTALVLTVTSLLPVRRLAHLRGHHVNYAMRHDTDTARRGESMFAFTGRAAVGAAVDGWRSERERLAKEGKGPFSLSGDIMQSVLLTLFALTIFGLLGGWMAVGLMAGAMLLSTNLVEGFNYLQHYGLIRIPGTRPEARHVWNHMTPVVRTISYELTNHAPHHMEPSLPYYKLRPDPKAPQMPSIVLCFLLALIPPLWERLVAQPYLRRWDMNYATPEERALAAKTNAEIGWPDWFSEQGAAPTAAASSAS